MLRGPQTVGELRIHSERLHRFADISSVEGFLHELAARPDGRTGRGTAAAAGRARDALGASAVADRLRCGSPSTVRHRRTPARRCRPGRMGELATLKANVTQLQDEVAALRATLDRLVRDLGLPPARRLHRVVALPAARAVGHNTHPAGTARPAHQEQSGSRSMDFTNLYDTAKPIVIAFGLQGRRRDHPLHRRPLADRHRRHADQQGARAAEDRADGGPLHRQHDQRRAERPAGHRHPRLLRRRDDVVRRTDRRARHRDRRGVGRPAVQLRRGRVHPRAASVQGRRLRAGRRGRGHRARDRPLHHGDRRARQRQHDGRQRARS